MAEHSSLRSQLIGGMGEWNNAGMGRRPSDKKTPAQGCVKVAQNVTFSGRHGDLPHENL